MDQSNLFEYLHETFKFKNPIRLIELFAGYGSQAMCFKKLQDEGFLNFEHYKVVEFDKYAIRSYNAVHEKNYETLDVREINAQDLEIVETDKYDYVMTYSFPCQDLSKAGKGKGMSKGDNTRSGLLWEVERILGECFRDNCLPQVLLLENVPEVIGTKNYSDFMKWYASLEACGYQSYYTTLNAKNFGIPQNRDRCFMISILGDYNYTFPKPFELKLRLKDVLESNVDEKYYLSERKIKYMKETSFVCSSYDKMVHEENDISSTLCARDYKDPKCVRVGDMSGGKWDNINESCRRVYSSSGISPTITAMGGGNQEPKIVEPICLNSKVNGKQPSLQDRIYDSNSISTAVTTSFMPSYLETGGERKVAIPEATKKGYALAGDGDYVNLAYMESKTRRGRVKEGVSQTLLCNDNNGVVVQADGVYLNDSERFHKAPIKNLSRTLKANKHDAGVVENKLLIRKLTPRECGRLMGVSDDDISKMLSVNSNSQCYKQFGNSIVVDVLYYIFKQMC